MVLEITYATGAQQHRSHESVLTAGISLARLSTDRRVRRVRMLMELHDTGQLHHAGAVQRQGGE